jgi:hypothetical protein
LGRVRPQAWRFRDYVIRSFNADKPFDRFVREQIAGDEMLAGPARDEAERDCLIRHELPAARPARQQRQGLRRGRKGPAATHE